MAISQPKIIYLARANPRLPRGGFTARWRQHGIFSRTTPVWRHLCRYEQCATDASAYDPSEWVPALGAQTDWDGVGMIWFWSFEAIQRAGEEPAVELLAADEEQTFDRLVQETALVAEETVLRDRGGTNVKRIAFLRRSPELTVEDFQRRWREHAAALLKLPQAGRVRKYVLNTAAPGNEGPLAGFDGVLEIGFDTSDDLRAFYLDEGYQALEAEEAGFVDLEAGINLVTDETLLYMDPLGDERLISERESG